MMAALLAVKKVALMAATMALRRVALKVGTTACLMAHGSAYSSVHMSGFPRAGRLAATTAAMMDELLASTMAVLMEHLKGESLV